MMNNFIIKHFEQEGAAVDGPPAMGPSLQLGISFSVRVKAHVPKTICKKK